MLHMISMDFYIDKSRYMAQDGRHQARHRGQTREHEMSTNLMAWMIAGSIAEEREREARRGAQARELRAALAAQRSATTGPTVLQRLRTAGLSLRRPDRSVESACCVA
jgi:hypothetical protein